jgi:cytoskeleton protein RodZ
MSDSTEPGAAVPPKPNTAGGLIRQARQAQGLHIAALAAAIKVVPRKLELLESDQFDQLPDATFTRALAQTVCRSLKIDAAPILALLPPPSGHRLEQVGGGLNTPFRERPGRLVPKEWASVANPALWLAALLVIGALVVYTMPSGWLPIPSPAVTRAPAAAASAASAAEVFAAAPAQSTASEPGNSFSVAAAASGADATVAQAAVSASAPNPSLADPTSDAPPPPGVLQLHASAQSWVEVIDARGQSLIARVLQPGEDVGLDGVIPLKVKIGNAGATQVVFRGDPIELPGFTRDNVARFELK